MTQPKTSRFQIWFFVIAGFALGLALVQRSELRTQLNTFLQWIHTLGFWAPLLFLSGYVLATVFLLPASILTLGAGAVFGMFWGFVYVSVASTLGAGAAFLVSRFCVSDLVHRKLEGNRMFKAVDNAVKTEGWRFVGLCRLSPILPFTWLNYAFGITTVKFSEYILASWIGMIPGTLLYVYLGSLAQLGNRNHQKSALEWGLYAIGLLATVVVTTLITRYAKKEFQVRTNSQTST